jgi:hypothetical protein
LILKKYFFENFNISENNIIIVEIGQGTRVFVVFHNSFDSVDLDLPIQAGWKLV